MAILTRDQLYARPNVQWWIEGILPKGQVCCVWGDADAGKSFLMVDWAGCILTGTRWQGREVKRGAVLYIPTENPDDFIDRFQGLERVHGSLAGLPWGEEEEGVQLLDENSVRECIRRIEALDWGPDILVIDTLGKAKVDGLHSPDPDKSRWETDCALRNADRIRRACGEGATVVLVSHSTRSKDTMAGSAALKQGVYMMAHLGGKADDGGTSRLHCDRLKKGTFPDITLRFREVRWDDDGGQARHTLVIAREGDAQAAATTGTGTGGTTAKPKRTKGTLTGKQHDEVLRLHRTGLSPAAIRDKTGLNYRTVQSTIRRAASPGEAAPEAAD